MIPEVLSCPFCRCSDVRIHRTALGEFVVMCLFCKAQVEPANSPGDAVESWNLRPKKVARRSGPLLHWGIVNSNYLEQEKRNVSQD